MELSPTRVRERGLFPDERNDFPPGSSQKPKHPKHQREYCSDSSEDERHSEGELIAHGKSKGQHRHRREKSESSDSDHSPQVCCPILFDCCSVVEMAVQCSYPKTLSLVFKACNHIS